VDRQIVLAGANNVIQYNSNGGTGKEIVPVNNNVQNGNEGARQEEVLDGTNDQQIQTSNMFAVLEVQDGDEAGRDRAVEVEVRSTANSTRKLNPTAAGFTPKSTGMGSTTRKGNTDKHKTRNNASTEDIQRESTTSWVNRAFNSNVVATNQSCQDVPSQATEIDATLKNINDIDGIQADGRKIWSQQVEEDSEEGELPEGACGEVESSDEEIEQEEQSVNNNDKGQQSVGNSDKNIQSHGDRCEATQDENGGQMLINSYKDGPPDKSKELQITDVPYEVGLENISVVGTNSDVVAVKEDTQIVHVVHKDQIMDDAVTLAGTRYVPMMAIVVNRSWVVLAPGADSQDEKSLYDNMGTWRTSIANIKYWDAQVNRLLKLHTHAHYAKEEQEEHIIHKRTDTKMWIHAKESETH
ncbi:hypothetical protein A4A49_57753, partial [Nicotiana attenuata]